MHNQCKQLLLREYRSIYCLLTANRNLGSERKEPIIAIFVANIIIKLFVQYCILFGNGIVPRSLSELFLSYDIYRKFLILYEKSEFITDFFLSKWTSLKSYKQKNWLNKHSNVQSTI